MIKNFYRQLIEDCGFDDQNKKSLYVKLFSLAVIQALSFLWKPFVFIELIVATLFIIFDKYENKVLYLFFLLPFYNVFRFSSVNAQYSNIVTNFADVYFSVWLLLVVCFCFLVRCISLFIKNRKIDFIPIIVGVVIYILFLVGSKTNGAAMNFSGAIVVGALIFLLLMYKMADVRYDLEDVARFWFFGVLLSVLLYCCKGFLPSINDYIVKLEGRFCALLRDPNYWGLELITLLCVFTTIRLYGKQKAMFPFCFIILSMLIMLTMSKACFITYLLYLLLYLIVGLTRLFKKLKKQGGKLSKRNLIILLISTVIIISVLIGLGFLMRDKIKALVSRFEYAFSKRNNGADRFLNALTTDRWNIWKRYIKTIFTNPVTLIFGRSILYGYEFTAIHNTPLQLFYFGGLINIALIIILLVVIIKKQHPKFINYLPALIIFVLSCSLDLLFSYRTYLLIYALGGCLAFTSKKSEGIYEKTDKREVPVMENKIPKKLHYIWLGGKKFPKIIKKCIKSWQKYCPDFEIILWNESNIEPEFVNDYYFKALNQKKYAFAADVLRFKILNKYGGIYVDTDVEIIKQLDGLLNNDFFVGFESYNYVAPGLIMGSVPNSVVVQEVCDFYDKSEFEFDEKNMDTVCTITTRILQSHGLITNNTYQQLDNGKIVVYPTEYFCPIDQVTKEKKITENTKTIHWYAGSWLSKRTKISLKFKNFIKWMLGPTLTKRISNKKKKQNEQ